MIEEHRYFYVFTDQLAIHSVPDFHIVIFSARNSSCNYMQNVSSVGKVNMGAKSHTFKIFYTYFWKS